MLKNRLVMVDFFSSFATKNNVDALAKAQFRLRSPKMSMMDLQVEEKLYREVILEIETEYLDFVVQTADIDWGSQRFHWKDTRLWVLACMANVKADEKTI